VNTPPNKVFYEFEDFRLDPEKQRLTHAHANDPIPLTPKAVEILRVLIERRGQIVERDELMNAVWPDVTVEDGNLSVTVSMVRKVLGEHSSQKFIETFPKRGYKFTADVREVIDNASAILVEKQTVGRVVIDENFTLAKPSLPKLFSSTRRKLATVTIAAAALVLVIGGFLYSSRSDTARARNTSVRSIAVLPFKLINPATDSNHLGLGLADVLITRLSNIKEINVRPTSAVMSFETTQESSTAIGKRLLVDAVLEGSILRTTDKIRVTAQLVKVGDQSTLWAAQFEKALKDELALQDEIALQVIDALALHLSSNEEKSLKKRYTQNADAYQLYLKGRYHWNRRNYGGLSEAERLFRNAIEKDPDFALAYVGLADSLMFYSASPELGAALSKAHELDPNLGEAWASSGFLLGIHLWKWKEAEEAFKKSIELNPGYATAHHWYGILLEIQGRSEEAKAELKRALEIDPLSYNFLADLGQVYYFNREYDKAEELCKKALDINPQFPFAHQYLYSIYLHKRQYDIAIDEFVKFMAYEVQTKSDPAGLNQKRLDNLETFRKPYQDGGPAKYFEFRIKRSKEDKSNLSNPNRPYGEAFYYSLLGNKEKAVESLEQAFELRAFSMAWVKAEPTFDSLRGEPRFKAILQKMNLPAD
jgi:DNA-binding winged helix-turn-helix (wHTH) protein/TolB-like protein/Flp pilus assembly protein TadD